MAVRIVRDRQSGMGKGFGYVLFEVRTDGRLQDTSQNPNGELVVWPYLTYYASDVKW